MSPIDYDERVRVLSFDASGVRVPGCALHRNPSFVTTLAKAVRLVCSDEWASGGNVLNGILRADGTIIGADEAQDMLAEPDFPGSSEAASTARGGSVKLPVGLLLGAR